MRASLGAVAGVLALTRGAASAGAQHLQFRHLGVDDGLPSSLVSDIAQDRRGFIWLGTAHGVSRYDGHRFRNYGHERDNPHSLAPGVVLQVYEDRAGGLWAVAVGGVSRYDGSRDGWTTYMRSPTTVTGSTPPRTATAVYEDGHGTLWVGTSQGLYALDRRTGAATVAPLARRRGGAGQGDSPLPYVEALLADRGGHLWVGTQDGLSLVDAAGRPVRRFAHDPADPTSLPQDKVISLAQDQAGRVWVGTGDGGLARLDAATGRFTRFRHDPADPHSLAKNRVVELAVDRSGAGLWVGTENGGLDFHDFRTGRFVHHQYDASNPAGLGSNSVWSIHQDAGGAVWVGTFSAGLDVSTFHGAAVRHFRTVPGDTASLSYNAVPALAEDRDGRVWVGTDGGGLNRFDPSTGRFTRYTTANTNLPVQAVTGVHVGRAGDVWVGTWGGGIARLDTARRRFTAYTRQTSDSPDDHVYELLEDRRGRLWAGTNDGFVAVFDRARGRFTWRTQVAAPGLAPSSVLQLRELHDGRLAVGQREGGVTVLDPATGARTHYLAGRDLGGRPGGLAGNNVRALWAEGAGVVWVGTETGLDRLELATGRARHYGTADGLPSDFVDGILPDARGRLWVSTDRGLARFDRAHGAFKTYTRADGLHGNEFLMRAALRARDGTLYFGGNGGFSVVRPEGVADNPRAPPVVLTGLQLFNRPVAPGAPGSPLRRPIGDTDTLTLTHAQNVVTFEFAALDYTAPEKTRYAYRLDGFDAGWQDVGHQHAASYTNLAPGRYTFRVKASNGDGVWNERGARLALVVTPPVWQTWWFRGAALALGAAGLFWLLRFQQRRRLEVALGRQALRDPLTGLANRALFRDRVGHALARLAREGTAAAGPADGAAAPPARVAVLFLDLDNFKTVNDSLGHQAGDRLLQGVAARLLNATRGCDTVARLGGDEFAVLLENARDDADARTVADRIAQALRDPVPVGEDAGRGAGAREARVAVSVGIAFAEPGVDADALLRNADAAMYQAKAEGKGRHAVFDPALVAAAADRLELENALAHALGRQEFRLVYQPIVSLTTGAVTGAEALVRWHHPARGLVSPARFIPLAEASGLIGELGRWVLNEACRAAAAWPQAAGGAAVGVTVNVSGRQLLNPALPGHVAAALAESGLPAERLTLEITESVLMHDTEATLSGLRALKALGVRLAVDDFGTGYSSLRYLQQFPVDVLKIDKSFVDGVARGRQDAALARTIVALGEMLALRTVAEGVEDAEQAEALRGMGCVLGQGYLFARPLDDEALRARLAAPVAVPGEVAVGVLAGR